MLNKCCIASCFLLQITMIYCSSCQPTSSDYFDYETFTGWMYHSFTSMSQLNLECDIATFGKSLIASHIPIIYFDMTMVGVLKEPIDLSGLANASTLRMIGITNLEGFDVEMPGPVVSLDQSISWLADCVIQFSTTRFDFYYQGQLIDERLCTPEIFDGIDVKLFTNLESSSIQLNNEEYFRNPVCPYVFKNASLLALRGNRFQYDLATQSCLKFTNVSNPHGLPVQINANVQYVCYIDLYNLDLDETVLSPHALADTQYFYIEGKIGHIQTGLLKNFHQLSVLRIASDILSNFVHLSTNIWLGDLLYQGNTFNTTQEMAAYVQQSQAMFVLMLEDYSHKYAFPDEDFCLFKHFPAKKAISTSFKFSRGGRSDVSCLVKYVSQNNALNPSPERYPDTLVFNETELGVCQFEKRLSMCFNLSKEPDTAKQEWTYVDFIFVLKLIDLLGPIVSFTFLAGVAFFLNLLIIFIIYNKANRKEKLFDSKQFDYIVLTSVFNCAECFIYMFKLVSMCINPTSIFCSTIRLNEFVKYLTVIFSGYLSETMKTCSIVTGLFFSLQRYIETSKTESRVLLKLSEIKMAKMAAGILLFSLIISVSKIFEFNFAVDPLYDTPDSFFVSSYSFQRRKLETYAYFAHYALNDLAILLANLVIDIMLVRSIKAGLAQKARLKTDMRKLSLDQVKVLKGETKAEADKRHKVENKANSLIISTVIIYIFCRFPELAGKIFVYMVGSIHGETGCFRNILCSLITNIIEFFYMISYMLNILLYYKFNTNFKRGFQQFFGITSEKSKTRK